jgi:hypothetical protein
MTMPFARHFCRKGNPRLHRYDAECRIALCTISSGVRLTARLSRITDTMIRVPRMHALPWHTARSAIIVSCMFTTVQFEIPISHGRRGQLVPCCQSDFLDENIVFAVACDQREVLDPGCCSDQRVGHTQWLIVILLQQFRCAAAAITGSKVRTRTNCNRRLMRLRSVPERPGLSSSSLRETDEQ